jgi:hypothetical protein
MKYKELWGTKQIRDTTWMSKKDGHTLQISLKTNKNLEKISQSSPVNGFMIKWLKD